MLETLVERVLTEWPSRVFIFSLRLVVISTSGDSEFKILSFPCFSKVVTKMMVTMMPIMMNTTKPTARTVFNRNLQFVESMIAIFERGAGKCKARMIKRMDEFVGRDRFIAFYQTWLGSYKFIRHRN